MNLKKNSTFLIGMVIIVLFLGGLVVYKTVTERNLVEPQIATVELSREATVEAFKEPKQIAKYMIGAILKQDMDMALRGCAIDERLLNVSVAEIIEQNDDVYTNLPYAPSSDYTAYRPITSSEITAEYVEQINHLMKLVSDKKLKIKSVDFVDPNKQTSEAYQKKSADLSKIWGMKLTTEIIIELEDENGLYMTGLTLAKYQDSWKVYALKASLADISEKELLKEVTVEEYQNYVNSAKETSYKKYLNDNKKLEKSETIDYDTALLAPNYFLANQQTSDSPIGIIERFTLYLQKRDFEGALTCFYNPSSEDYVEKIRKQSDNARQLQNFCFSFYETNLKNDENIVLETNLTGKQVVGLLGVYYLRYMDLVDVFEIKDKDSEKEYLAVYSYENENYKIGYTVVKTKEGWALKSLSAEGFIENQGIALPISDNEIERLEKEMESLYQG